MTFKPSTAFILDTRRSLKLKDGLFPIKYRVTFQRKSKLYRTGVSCTKDDFIKIWKPNVKGKLAEHNTSLNVFKEKGVGIINQLSEFSFTSFDNLFTSKIENHKSVYEAYEVKIDQLYEQERIGSGDTYKNSLSSLRKFQNHLSFDQITVPFLERYERFMINIGNSLTTVGFYLRPLRTIFNEAVRKRIISSMNDPFDKDGYQIPTGRNIKKALTLPEIALIFNFKPRTNSQARARDLWIFSYLGNGLNVKDIANLKYSNISNDTITFIRKKTERKTRSRPILISFPIDKNINRIINKWGSKPKIDSQYIFNIHSGGISAIEMKKREKAITKTINRYMRQIATACDINKKITTYTARHSFSTVLSNANTPVKYISESLGHGELRSTDAYLGSLENNKKLDIQKKLTDF